MGAQNLTLVFSTFSLQALGHSIWCGARDSNPHVLSDTATSRLRVYQFRQLRMFLIILVFVTTSCFFTTSYFGICCDFESLVSVLAGAGAACCCNFCTS